MNDKKKMKKIMINKQIKRREKQLKKGKFKDYKLRERNNQRKKKKKRIKNLMRRAIKNKLPKPLMNQFRKKMKIKKKKKKFNHKIALIKLLTK